MSKKEAVAVRLDEEIINEIDKHPNNRSEFIRTAIREKLNRPTVNSRVNQLEEEIKRLSDEINDIRSALLEASQHSSYNYKPKPGDLLNENEN